VAVLLVLVTFVETGDLDVILSCTESLQTFKRPTKLHSGELVAAATFIKFLRLCLLPGKNPENVSIFTKEQ
jgi:hypothetical protein